MKLVSVLFSLKPVISAVAAIVSVSRVYYEEVQASPSTSSLGRGTGPLQMYEDRKSRLLHLSPKESEGLSISL